MHRDHPALGGLLTLLASLMFASLGAVIRSLSTELSTEPIVFFRNLFGLLILLPVLWQQGFPSLRTRRPGLHLLRSLAGLAAMYCFFYALGQLRLAEAVLLNFSAPLFIPLIAALWLGERTTRPVAIAISIGFLGILLILKPGIGLFSPAAYIGLASGVFAALAMVSLRRITSTEPATRVVFYYGVVCTLVSAVPMLWAWQTPDAGQLLRLAATGLFATAGQLLLTRGYALAPAAQVGPFTYTAVVFAGLYGWFFWQEMPDLLSLAGAGLVIGAGVLAIRRS
ncbi:DMT family transporter [Thiohalobacter sp. IOR34]|uniref:DMT family transporter n=1 Tax=Thiohalobacter sp. IOR34 TaxID=3057176 RepID=UPI0025B1C928|nr:DMT family transporter [Thiohalobacter sp. IOR34]WJW76326.1 DMT family transporter [Thiohalobacter sp. IOR34]